MMRSMLVGACPGKEDDGAIARCGTCDRREKGYNLYFQGYVPEPIEPAVYWHLNPSGTEKRLICENHIPLLTDRLRKAVEEVQILESLAKERAKIG